MSNDLWELPQVVSVDAVQSHYNDPLIRYVGGQRVEYHDVVEIWVQTSEPLPMRALSAAIYIGETLVDDYEAAGENQYRFFAFDSTALDEGAPIAIGWPQFPENRVDTGLTFTLSSA